MSANSSGFSIRSVADDNSWHTLYASVDDDMRYIYTDAQGNNITRWSSLTIETHSVSVNGTSSLNFTMNKVINNWASRAIIAVSNGGSTGGRHIISVIPTSSTAVTVNYDGNLPSSGTVFVTFIYQIA